MKRADLIRLRQMVEGERITINWANGGGGQVDLYHGVYLLYEVPCYGGDPMYHGPYKECDLDELMKVAYSWT